MLSTRIHLILVRSRCRRLPKCRDLVPAVSSLAFVCLLFAFPVSAGTLSGTVKNGTTGKALAHQSVTLLSVRSGMEELISVETGSDGRFEFNRPEIGQGPLLVRVTFQNVGYFQAAPPGRDTVDITVFDSSAPASAVHIASRTIIFQPNGPRLLVGEDFTVENNTNPPATYANSRGTFEFGVPDRAQLSQVSATGPGGMPLTQGTMDKGKNRYAVDFAIKPGETNFRVAYDLPYNGDRASVAPVILAPVPRVMIAAPVGVQIVGDGFTPAGVDQGFTLLTRDTVSPGVPLSISLSGAATVQAQGQPSGGGQPAGPDAGTSAPAGEAIQVISPRLSSFQWIVLGGMGLFFLAGFFFLMRQPAAAGPHPPLPSAAGTASLHAPVATPERTARPRDIGTAPAATPSASAVLAEADRGARMNLEELKDTLFRLELRRQAGTISEADYARERARIEIVIRDLVRG